MKILFLFLLFVFIQLTEAQSFGADDSYNFYQVEKGDHLAEVLRQKGFIHLWGVGGDVQQTIRLNPVLAKDRADILPVGAVILLPKKPLDMSVADKSPESAGPVQPPAPVRQPE